MNKTGQDRELQTFCYSAPIHSATIPPRLSAVQKLETEFRGNRSVLGLKTTARQFGLGGQIVRKYRHQATEKA
jgi:hypothetical protein